MDIATIKKYMKNNKITYQQLADRSGLSISTIKKLFSGISNYPRIDTMKRIEEALQIEEWSESDLRNGIVSTISVSISPIEEELLSVGRDIKEKLGDAALQGFIAIGEGILKNYR